MFRRPLFLLRRLGELPGPNDAIFVLRYIKQYMYMRKWSYLCDTACLNLNRLKPHSPIVISVVAYLCFEYSSERTKTATVEDMISDFTSLIINMIMCMMFSFFWMVLNIFSIFSTLL